MIEREVEAAGIPAQELKEYATVEDSIESKRPNFYVATTKETRKEGVRDYIKAYIETSEIKGVEYSYDPDTGDFTIRHKELGFSETVPSRQKTSVVNNELDRVLQALHIKAQEGSASGEGELD